MQARATRDDAVERVRRSGLRPTHTPSVPVTRGHIDQQMGKPASLAPLHERIQADGPEHTITVAHTGEGPAVPAVPSASGPLSRSRRARPAARSAVTPRPRSASLLHRCTVPDVSMAGKASSDMAHASRRGPVAARGVWPRPA
ncbi:hypothetical protein [Streptomyces sp. NPDC001275]